jgi:quercetin dioxygenase-like cupin family protein
MALHHAKPGEIVYLRPLGSALKDTATTALVKSDRFEAMRLLIRAGAEIPSHEVSGNITLHCLEGAVELGLKHAPVELRAGDWIYLDGGEEHSVKALEDSALLLTIIFNN